MTRSGADRQAQVFTGVEGESSVERRSRYASVGVVAVLLGVSVFALWSSQATSSAANQAVLASQLSDDYADAATAVSAQESLERKYRLEPGPDVEARYDEAAAMFIASLDRVQRDGSVDDRSFTEDVLTKHESYLRSTKRLFRATDRGDTAAALKIDAEEVDPSFDAMEAEVLAAATAKHQKSLSELGALLRLEGVTRTLTPAVFLLGLLLVAALAAVTRGHRRLLQWLSAHHQGILASVAQGVINVDDSGHVTFANPAAGATLGAECDSLLGTTSCAITCAASPEPGHRCVLDLVREAGTPVVIPNGEFVRVDGTRFPVDVTASPRLGPGSESGVVLVFADRTEQLVVLRMKSEFISAVSHELRTPLSSIRGALEIIEDGEAGDLPPIASKLVATALRGSERLTRLISDIIDVERLEAGSFPMHIAELEVGPLVDTAVTDLQILAAESGIKLVVTGAAGRARCDADRVIQAMVNLVGNAIKFSPPGGTVEISAEPLGEFVQFRVADSGRGIPATELESIFERFHQVDASDAREKAGTGLGLPITKSIVEQHGGRIWVDSSPGRGSKVWFTLPRGEGEGEGKDIEPLDLIQLRSA